MTRNVLNCELWCVRCPARIGWHVTVLYVDKVLCSHQALQNHTRAREQ